MKNDERSSLVKTLALCGVVFGFALIAAAGAEPGVGSLVRLASFDAHTLKGAPARLAWSVDDTSLYLGAEDKDAYGHVKTATHFVILLSDDSVKGLDREPQWADAYWQWKASRRSPTSATEMIEVESGDKEFHSAHVPTGGDLGRAGADTGQSVKDAWLAATSTQHGAVSILKWKGSTLGEWVNEIVLPGMIYSWAPPPRLALVYAQRESGQMIIVGADGHRQEIVGAKSAMLPAWSQHGAKIAWVERTDRKHFAVVVTDAPDR